MTRLTIAAAAILAGLSAPAAAQSDTRRFDVGRFAAIDLTGGDRVRVVPGTTMSVVASGDPRALAALDIAVRGDTLRIGRRKGTWRDRGALVTVTMPMLRAASISGSGGITAEGVAGTSFAGTIGGSGSLRLNGLRVGTARFDLAGSGSIVAEGRAEAVEIDLGGSGGIDTRALATPTLAVDLAGSGSVDAVAARTARIRAGGSGSINVSGGAACDVDKAGSGRVRCG